MLCFVDSQSFKRVSITDRRYCDCIMLCKHDLVFMSTLFLQLQYVPLVIKEARRPLGGQGQNLRSKGQQTTGGSVLVPASTTVFRGMK